MSKLTDYYFWFAQPSSILDQADRYILYLFGSMLIVAVVLWIVRRMTPHQINKKLLSKFYSLFLYIGISGVIWYGLRFENTLLLGRRFIAGVIAIVGLVWLVFVLKYAIADFRSEKKAYEKELVKSKYLPR